MSEINLEHFEIVKPDHSILSEKRSEKGFTQQQVADYAKITLRQYQRYENGERLFLSTSLRAGLAICSMLDIDPYHFQFRYNEFG